MADIVYTRPYPGGFRNKPSTSTPINARVAQIFDDGIANATAQANLALQKAAAALAAAQAIAGAGSSIGIPVNPGGYYPMPALPSGVPVVNYDSIAGATASNVGATLAQGGPVTQQCIIRFTPNKDYFLGDAIYGAWTGVGGGGYSLYAPNVLWLICDGAGTDPTKRARIHVPAGAMSAATAAKIPKQTDSSGNPTNQTNNIWAVRWGPNQNNSLIDIGAYGIEFVGHDQINDPNTGKPMTWNGVQYYYPGANSHMTWCKLTGFGRADFNSPPGETNCLSTDGGAGFNLYGVETTGFNGDGVRTSGATSANGTDAIYAENCYVHDSVVSGFTSSIGDNQKPCGSLHTVNLKVANNANHSSANGQQFCGVNSEGVLGPILHQSPDLLTTLDYDNTHGGLHFGVQNGVGLGSGNADVTITAPVYHGISPSWAHGALAYQTIKHYPNSTDTATQTKMPTIISAAGVTLTPMRWDDPNIASIDPTKQYCFIDAWV